MAEDEITTGARCRQDEATARHSARARRWTRRRSRPWSAPPSPWTPPRPSA